MNIAEAIKHALDNKASDIHLGEDDGVWIRKHKHMLQVDHHPIESADMTAFLGMHSRLVPYENGEMDYLRDFALEAEGRRLRANYYRARGVRKLTMRVLADKIPSLESLHMPPELKMLHDAPKGLILLVGETGSGKSTTIASLIQQHNEQKADNIITIEDPVEYIFVPQKSRISQREIGRDVINFAQGIKDAMREDPDTIFLGEMRDYETIKAAVTAAETGHLVFGTMHCRNCAEAPDRAVDVCPGDEKESMRSQFCNVLQAVVHQTLVPNEEYGMLPLLEIMRVNEALRKSLKGNTPLETIRQTLRTMRSQGALHRADCYKWLMSEYYADAEVASAYLSEDDFKLMSAR